MKDDKETICFMNVMWWCLLWFDDGQPDQFTWQTQRMSNYLWYLLTEQLDVLDPEKLEKIEICSSVLI